MKNTYQTLLISWLIMPISLFAQKPEKQVSFAQVPKPHSYYVEQAELWWKEIEKDKTKEMSWYNYFRACRNAAGTAGWSKDFDKESEYLRHGYQIVELMKENIPNTFVYNYAVWCHRGFDPTKGAYLLKAYEMNSDFEGIHSTMITYSNSEFNYELRKKVNQKWFSRNEMSPGLLTYGYNVLMSLEQNGIIFTQHDNDTYPLWMLQDVKNIRTDVTVINFDMLLVKSYREKVFKKYNIAPLDKEFEESNPYNLEAVLTHILANYQGDRPLYVGLSVTPTYYQNHNDKLFVSGLALKYSDKPVDLMKKNKELIENSFLFDYLKIQLTNDLNQSNVNEQNVNYLKCFKIVYDDYKSSKIFDKAKKIKELALLIAQNSSKKDLIRTVNEDFK